MRGWLLRGECGGQSGVTERQSHAPRLDRRTCHNECENRPINFEWMAMKRVGMELCGVLPRRSSLVISHEGAPYLIKEM